MLASNCYCCYRRKNRRIVKWKVAIVAGIWAFGPQAFVFASLAHAQSANTAAVFTFLAIFTKFSWHLHKAPPPLHTTLIRWIGRTRSVTPLSTITQKPLSLKSSVEEPLCWGLPGYIVELVPGATSHASSARRGFREQSSQLTGARCACLGKDRSLFIDPAPEQQHSQRHGATMCNRELNNLKS